MSYSEEDARYDGAMDALYQEFVDDPYTHQHFYAELYDEIVQGFRQARLCSYYKNEPMVAESAFAALEDAKRLLLQNETAAFLFAVIAAEVTLKSTLLTPIIHGLVHADSAAALITKLAISAKDENFFKTLLDLLAIHGGVDPRTHKREGSPETLWQELKRVQVKRNRVVHSADRASVEEAELAIAVATCLLDCLFPTVVRNLGLELHGKKIC